MKHILFHENAHNLYDVAVLVKESSFNSNNIDKHYIKPLIDKGLAPDSILALSLKYNEKNKAPVKLIKEHLQTILKACGKLNTMTLLVSDTAYFKTLTGKRKAEPYFGYILPCKIKGFEHINIILSVNYQALFYNPNLQSKLDMSISTLINHINGTHVDLGQNIIQHSEYPETRADIVTCLKKLMNHPVLTCDIETKSLALNEAGIATIAFAWNQHEGIAFAVDRGPTDEVRKDLRTFFKNYKGKLIYHGGTYDIKILIYELFMLDPLDNVGIHKGLECLTKNIDDTKLITYLATNTTAGNVLGLKPNAFEFAGNYAQDDIKDTTLIPLPDLLKYNLIDCLATWYVYNKNYPVMIQDDQQEIYETIMRPSMKVIIHMELNGMPMDYATVLSVHQKLKQISEKHLTILRGSQIIKDYEWQRQREAMFVANLLLKKKVKPFEDFEDPFNPNSSKQLQELLYNTLGFEVIDTTDTGLPATGGETLQKLLNKLTNEHNLTDKELE